MQALSARQGSTLGARVLPNRPLIANPSSAAACRLQHKQHRQQRCPRTLSCRAEAGSRGGLSQLLQQAQTEPDALRWSRATVVENREASADGTARTLLLSVEDHVNFLDGRRVRHVQENRRWIDDYRVPGQFVAVRYCGAPGSSSTEDCSDLRVARRLLSLASSPYEARRDSAMLDASLVELLVSRGGDDDERHLAELGPGAMIDVSRVAGAGFCSLFNPSASLMACLEAGHPLIMLACGARGIAPVRAALSWTPVLAHAGSSRVAVYYVADSQEGAAYLVEWDGWREAGAVVAPLYLSDASGNGSSGNGAAGAQQLLETALFSSDGGFAAVLGGKKPGNAAVLMSGLGGDVAAHLTRRLAQHGIENDSIMFCDY